MIDRYLGLTMSAERALADAFVHVGLRHATEPEMRNAARLHSNWCNANLDALRRVATRYGAKRNVDGERLRRALFRGLRYGGLGLVRDLHDLLTLATLVHGCWMGLLQAARESRDDDLEAVCRQGDATTVRQICWLETKLRASAPQALTTPSQVRREIAASIPSLAQIGDLVDLVPRSTVRALMPLTPAAAALVVAVALIFPAWLYALRH
jgi:hypothetical protein